MALMLLVEYSDIKRKLTVDNVNSVQSAIEKEFCVSLQDHHLYYWDKDFDDWISVEEVLSVIENKSKLLVKKKCKLVWCLFVFFFAWVHTGKIIFVYSLFCLALKQ